MGLGVHMEQPQVAVAPHYAFSTTTQRGTAGGHSGRARQQSTMLHREGTAPGCAHLNGVVLDDDAVALHKQLVQRVAERQELLVARPQRHAHAAVVLGCSSKRGEGEGAISQGLPMKSSITAAPCFPSASLLGCPSFAAEGRTACGARTCGVGVPLLAHHAAGAEVQLGTDARQPQRVQLSLLPAPGEGLCGAGGRARG